MYNLQLLLQIQLVYHSSINFFIYKLSVLLLNFNMKVNMFFGLDGKEKASPAKYGKRAPVWICRELSGSQ